MTSSNIIASHYGSKKGLLNQAYHTIAWRMYPAICYPDIPGDTRRLIFICQGNICRSAIAQAIADKMNINADSYGLDTTGGDPADRRMQKIAIDNGYTLEDHTTQSIRSFNQQEGDLMLVMDLYQYRTLVNRYGKQLPVSLLGLWSHNPRAYIHDPYSCGNEYFQTCYNLIEGAVINLGKAMNKR